MGHAVHHVAHKVELGRHTRVRVPFSWKMAGELVDLIAEGYTVRVWVQASDGTESGPFAATLATATVAEYNLSLTDLDTASPTPVENVRITAVAENGTHTLVSDVREITVGDWGGADDYEPA